ncbi:MAG: hypothetical protein AAGF12_07785 [Myxococcota bacterium]
MALAVAGFFGGCTKFQLVDVVMASAYRPDDHRSIDVGPYQLLAGDFHCHVSPPDVPSHVDRNLQETVELAAEENIDFLVLTPHIWGQFYADPQLRDFALDALDALEASAPETDILLTYGFEYSTGRGHASMGFADLDEVLAGVSPEEFAANPDLFFQRWNERGGLIVINHPLLTPTRSLVANARWNLSWRPWTSFGPHSADIRSIHRRAVGYEAENSAVTHLRDEFLVARPHSSRRAVLRLMDRTMLRERRRLVPIGGSDSHSHHLRAVTFVLATERSLAGVRAAVQAGRVCVRDPAACTLEASADGGPYRPLGSALRAEETIRVRWRAGAGTLIAGGREHPFETELELPASEECTIVRAETSAGASGPIFVNCAFAEGADS